MAQKGYKEFNAKIPRPAGMIPIAFTNYIDACNTAGLKAPRIVQTVGNASASKGFHAKDGVWNGQPYCAAIDISVKGFLGVGGYHEAQIKWLLFNMAKFGYVGWYRYRKPFNNNRHIHAIYVNVGMKEQLRRQVVDFLNDRDGLVGHKNEVFWTANNDLDDRLRAQFLAANPSAKSLF